LKKAKKKPQEGAFSGLAEGLALASPYQMVAFRTRA
jgi:hypothetical protein